MPDEFGGVDIDEFGGVAVEESPATPPPAFPRLSPSELGMARAGIPGVEPPKTIGAAVMGGIQSSPLSLIPPVRAEEPATRGALAAAEPFTGLPPDLMAAAINEAKGFGEFATSGLGKVAIPGMVASAVLRKGLSLLFSGQLALGAKQKIAEAKTPQDVIEGLIEGATAPVVALGALPRRAVAKPEWQGPLATGEALPTRPGAVPPPERPAVAPSVPVVRPAPPEAIVTPPEAVAPAVAKPAQIVAPPVVESEPYPLKLTANEESALSLVPNYVADSYRAMIKARRAADEWYASNPPPSAPKAGTFESPMTGQSFEAAQSRWKSRKDWDAAMKKLQDVAEKSEQDFLDLNAIRNNTKGEADATRALLKYANKLKKKQVPSTPEPAAETPSAPAAKEKSVETLIPPLYIKKGNQLIQMTPIQASEFHRLYQRSKGEAVSLPLYDSNGKQIAHVSPNGRVWMTPTWVLGEKSIYDPIYGEKQANVVEPSPTPGTALKPAVAPSVEVPTTKTTPSATKAAEAVPGVGVKETSGLEPFKPTPFRIPNDELIKLANEQKALRSKLFKKDKTPKKVQKPEDLKRWKELQDLTQERNDWISSEIQKEVRHNMEQNSKFLKSKGFTPYEQVDLTGYTGVTPRGQLVPGRELGSFYVDQIEVKADELNRVKKVAKQKEPTPAPVEGKGEIKPKTLTPEQELERIGAKVDRNEKLTPSERKKWDAAQTKREETKPQIMAGPGSPSRTQPMDPTGAQIEQLSQAFRNITATKAPLLQRIKEAFKFGQQRELSKNLMARTLSALKTSGDYIINTWKGDMDIDAILKAKGLLSAELEARGWRLRKAMADMKAAVPDKSVREAISKYVDAGGDMEKLRIAAETVPATRRDAYLRAMKLTPDEKIIAGHIRSYFDARLQEAMDAGVLSHGIEDYIHRIYPKDTEWRRGIINAVQNAVLDTRKPGLAKQRVFELDAEAEKAGHMPVSDFIPRILDYEASLSKVIASREAVKRFTEIRMKDGRPMLDVSGIGTPIETPEGVREATLIKPSFKPGERQLDESGNPTKNYRLDYQSRDYPALKRWRWATNDENGNPIFVEGDVLVHPDAVHRIDALLEPSKVQRYPVARAALSLGSTVKQTMLDFSGFHQVQIAVHGLEHKVNPFNLVKDVDTTDPKVWGLLKGGMTLGGQHVSGMYQEGLVGRSLSRQIPGLGPLMQSYHDWLFQNFIPRVKTTMALHALERNRARFAKELASGKMTEDALYFQTAKEANAAFGELNYIMLERSKTAQDLARLVLLAPDFLEARGRFALQAGTKLGGEQRMALLLGALTLYTVARLFNKSVNNEWHFEPENAFSLIHNGKAYSLRTVQGDVLHAVEEPVRFWLHRLNPTITRPLFELATGRDEFGRRRSFWQVLGDSISNVIPISLRSGREQSLWTSMLNSFGGSVRRDSDIQRTFQRATAWKEKNNIRTQPGEFIYDPSRDIYRPMKLALLDGNREAAAKEYRKLVASKTVTPDQIEKHFLAYANSAFAGSAANESRFVRSLSQDEKHSYEAARQEKQRMLREFYRARSLSLR